MKTSYITRLAVFKIRSVLIITSLHHLKHQNNLSYYLLSPILLS